MSSLDRPLSGRLELLHIRAANEHKSALTIRGVGGNGFARIEANAVGFLVTGAADTSGAELAAVVVHSKNLAAV